jgi:acetolactate synthase I/III small subunit
MKQKHIISALVENHSGVLSRVSTLVSGRGFNIDSLAVGETHDPSVSRMTIVTVGDGRALEQVIKQLGKLIDVIKVVDINTEEMIDRELMLVKVNAAAQSRSDVMQIVNTFRAKVVDVNPHSMVIEVTGGESKVDAMLELLTPYGITEVVRTGLVAMSRRSTLVAPAKLAVKTKKLTATKEEAAALRKREAAKKKSRQMAKDGL